MAERLGEGTSDLHQFHADYWEDKVYIGGKVFPAGYFIVSLLNYRDLDLFATRSGGDEINALLHDLDRGCLQAETVEKAEQALLERCKAIKRIPPFDCLDTEQYEARWIDFILREQQQKSIRDYMDILSKQTPRQLFYSEQRQKDDHTIAEGKYFYDRLQSTLKFYYWFYDDCLTVIGKTRQLVESLDAIPKYDEAHLIKITQELYEMGYSLHGLEDEHGRRNSFRVSCSDTEYVALQPPGKKKPVTARRIHFTRMLDFLITDFFEGIHNNHYPKKCAVCGRYFLIRDGRNQKYCNGIDPNDERGRSCRKVAASKKRHDRENPKTHPVKVLCQRRLNTIWQHEHRGKITPEFADAARKIAKDRCDRAVYDTEYANTQYEKDITQEAVYAAAKVKLK